MAWQSPKTDWGTSDGVRNTDMNRIEGNILELYNIDGLRVATTIYVSTSGNDTSGTGTSASPYRTITKAISMLPRNLNGNTATINVTGGTYSEAVNIKGFTGGMLLITGSGVVTLNSLTVDSCTVEIRTIDIAFTGISSTAVSVTNTGTLICYGYITVTGTGGAASTALRVSNCSSAHIGGRVTSTQCVTAVDVNNNSSLYMSQLAGSGATTGMRAIANSTISYGSSSISASVLRETSNGGRIHTGSQSAGVLTVATLEE